MKLFTGWAVSAGLILAATAANAQSPRYSPVSDFDGPYAAVPREAPPPPYGGPMLLPPQEVYTVVRESGFSPLGVPRLRGLVYTIAVIDRRGDDGRLVIDARTGRIIRFVPAYRMGDNFSGDLGLTYGAVRGRPRPPASIPHVASRTPAVPLPKAPPPRADEARPQAATPVPAPPQQSAAVQAKPPDAAQTVPQAAAPPPVEVKPAANQIQPTQEMPKVQGLDQ
jgi:hypothetical protein